MSQSIYKAPTSSQEIEINEESEEYAQALSLSKALLYLGFTFLLALIANAIVI